VTWLHLPVRALSGMSRSVGSHYEDVIHPVT
jgi:hypothetical protein